jgi:2-oxoglutarate ferredoxin oxidoreductase subunit alpha
MSLMNSATPMSQPYSFSIAVAGSGGSGALTVGLILMEAAAEAGLYGLMTRSSGPQIRGGESASMLRIGATPVACLDDTFDLLLGLDWLNADRFADEIPLSASSLILANSDAGEVPGPFLSRGATVHAMAFKKQAATVEGGRLNMVALGAAGAQVGLPREALEAAVHKVLGRKGASVIDASIGCVALGYNLPANASMPAPHHQNTPMPRWNISGNEACGLGALRGGVRFVAAYPITPASDILEWLAPRLEKLGGTLLQAEDELASINMIVGASFGGVPALTATSGPGLSLMLEGLGLAVSSEIPVVVIDVTRAGPSTGIPTKSEQSDLNIALYGMHGEAPHLVLAPLDVRDCVFTTQWAVRLAEHLQAAAIVLSDQSLGQARAVTEPPTGFEERLDRKTELSPTEDYRRFAPTWDGISPMTLPGVAGGMYTADGLEHDEQGIPSSLAADHQQQLDKRREKIESFDYGAYWAETSGSGELCLICWGSTSGAVREAAERLRGEGRAVRVIAMRLLAPLRREALAQALAGATQVWVVEQNHSGQLHHYLQAHEALPVAARSYARPGPLPLRPGEIIAAITEQE